MSPAHVILQMGCPLGPVRAVGASIWLFSCVDTHMAAEVACAQEGDSPTVGAQMWGNLSLTVHLTALQREPDVGVTGHCEVSMCDATVLLREPFYSSHCHILQEKLLLLSITYCLESCSCVSV